MTQAPPQAITETSRRIRPARKLTGVVTIPGDKSISHRALMFAAAANGESRIVNLAPGVDVESTRRVLASLGVDFRQDGEALVVTGVGRAGFSQPGGPLDCGNSGTTIRLLAGLLAGSPHTYELTGDASLCGRPMQRIADPLRQMGIDVELSDDGTAPIKFTGGTLSAIDYELEIPSAQIKSAVILAALSATGTTHIREPVVSRDHTEIMLSHMGAPVRSEQVVLKEDHEDPRRRGIRRTDERTIAIEGPGQWDGADLTIPGDFSTAAYFIAAALLVRRSDIRMSGIGANSTRTGFLAALSTMGAKLGWQKRKTVFGESMGDLKVSHASLSARKISGKLIPRLIDELPLLAVVATQASGTTVIRDAAELRHKESDRIVLTAENLKRMGAKVGVLEDGLVIEGPTRLSGADIQTGGDHRIAMSFAIAALAADGETELDDAACVSISCPGFFDLLDALR